MTKTPIPNYLAISLGPIYQTIKKARKTRELWVASYLFSYYMREIRKGCAQQSGWEILLPQLVTDTSQPLFGAGIYPDRMFVKLPNRDEAAVKAIIQTALDQVRTATQGWGKLPGFRGDPVRFLADIGKDEFWKNYFRTAYLLAPAAAVEASGNILFTLNNYLDTLELQPNYFAEEPKADGLLYLLEYPYRTSLAKEGLERNDASAYAELTVGKGLVERFPNTAELSSLQLFQHDAAAYQALQAKAVLGISEEPEDAAAEKIAAEEKIDTRPDSSVAIQEFYRLLYETEASVLKHKAADYHKYFCIVHADGDNFGKVISGLATDTEAIKAFSQQLADYAAQAAGIVNRYGGKPVYIGGDDLLFFAPLVSEPERGSPKTVFDLIKALDQSFAAANIGEGVSLSYGLTITYYKFPLFEARDQSYSQLFDRAKKVSWNGKEKNSVAFRLLKHSGSYFEGLLNKDLLEEFNDLCKQFVTGGSVSETDTADLLSSFAYKLQSLEHLIDSLQEKNRILPLAAEPAESQTTDALDHLFTNFFNEPIHRKYATQLQAVKKLARICYTSKAVMKSSEYGPCSCTKETTKPVKGATNLYALLRLLLFMAPNKQQQVKTPTNAPVTGN